MKRKILLVLLLCLLVTGCGEKKIENKTLVCKINSVILENEVEERLSAQFVEDNLKSANLEVKMLVNEKYIDYKDILETNLLNSYVDYQNKEGITFNLLNEENSIKLNISIDFEKIESDSMNVLGLNSEQNTYNDAYETLTKNGFICS